MKIKVEFDIDIDSEYGDILNDSEVMDQLINHLNLYRDTDLDDLVGDFNAIKVPSSKCWDCYTFIRLIDFKIIE